ncbi:hypothetical protein RJ639_009126 [Escallonia herrerae]|uniref:Acetyl-CoA carboxylase beta subunit n=1 Tax=Escallonia herrerae TaxID=1293975 RepID=A0AA88W034_9ASTE|nr:hypothetical protein RJ639_009126 [Escallonia herrerae]
MERWWFDSMLFKEFKHRCGLSKLTDSLGPIENPSESEYPNINDTDKKIPSWSGRDTSSYINVDHLFGVKDIRNFISDDTFLVRDSNGESYSIYFYIKNQSFEINNGHSFQNELESSSYSDRNSSYLNNGSKGISTLIVTCMILNKVGILILIVALTAIFSLKSLLILTFIRTSTNGNDLTIRESSNNLDVTKKYRHLWVQCENCYGLNYKKFLK